MLVINDGDYDDNNDDDDKNNDESDDNDDYHSLLCSITSTVGTRNTSIIPVG